MFRVFKGPALYKRRRMLAQTHIRCADFDRPQRIMILGCVGEGVGVAAEDVNAVECV